MQVCLRAVRLSDLPVFFEHQCDTEAARIAGFTPRERAAFDEHWRKIIAGPDFTVSTIEVDGEVAGYVSAFPREEKLYIAYWLGREHWRKGIGRRAVSAFLSSYDKRPIFGSVIDRNIASLAILRRCGFEIVAEETGPDNPGEHVLRLD